MSPGAYMSSLLQLFYHRMGLLIGKHPWPFLLCPILFTAFSTVGLLRFYEENRIWYLYSPVDAPSHYEHAVANQFFEERGGKFWLMVPVTAKDTGNLLRPGYLEAVEWMADYIRFNFTIDCDITDSGQCTFADLCTGQCNDNQVWSIFRLLYRDEKQRNHPNFRLTYPTMQLYNDEYYVGEHFSGVEVDPGTNLISSIRLAMLYFRTDRGPKEIGMTLDKWELGILDLVYTMQHPLINISVSSDGLISHEVRRNGFACMPYFALSIVLVLAFCIGTNFDANDRSVGVLEMAIGVSGPLLAIYTTFGLMFLMGYPFNSITLVMPFLIIGIGVDDFFIVVHAWRMAAKAKNSKERIAHALSEAGPSITITSLTNGVCFGIGGVTSTPAICIFCLYTALGVILCYIYQVTFFAAAVVLAGHRLEKRQINEARAKQIDQPTDSHTNNPVPLSTKPAALQLPASLIKVTKTFDLEHQDSMINKYCHLLYRWPIRLSVYLLTFLYWASAIYGVSKMKLKMDSSNLMLRDSPLQASIWNYDQFLGRKGGLVYIFVNNPPDISKFRAQNRLLDMVERFESLPFSMGYNSTSIFLRSLLEYAILFEEDEDFDFYKTFSLWLQDYDNGGGRWNEYLHVSNRSGRMQLDKFFFATGTAMGEQVSWNTRLQIQHNWRRVADLYREYNVTVFEPSSFYVDQLESIASTTFNTVVVAFITMAVVCLLLIPNPTSVVSATLAMVSINLGVFGYLFLWNVNLDPISMCTILMSIGFSVDFTSHISYHFYKSDETMLSQNRLADALSGIGWPMFQAGISTVLGVSTLLFVNSYMVIVFFKTVFLVVLLGLLHGLVFLPALLLSVGRLSCSCRKCKKRNRVGHATSSPAKFAGHLDAGHFGADTNSYSVSSSTFSEASMGFHYIAVHARSAAVNCRSGRPPLAHMTSVPPVLYANTFGQFIASQEPTSDGLRYRASRSRTVEIVVAARSHSV